MGDYDAAIEDYTQALTINPDYALAYNNRGNALRIKGEHDKAMVDFNRAWRVRHPIWQKPIATAVSPGTARAITARLSPITTKPWRYRSSARCRPH